MVGWKSQERVENETRRNRSREDKISITVRIARNQEESPCLELRWRYDLTSLS